LLSQEKLIGAMPIWGGDLTPDDNPVLELFARQVANVLQSAFTRENDSKRASELARSNAMILALSKIATTLGNSSNSELALDALGSEIRGLGLDCGIVTLDPDGEEAKIKYLSFDTAMIKTIEKLAGVSAKNYVIPKRYWPDDRASREKVPVWYSDPGDMLRRMFPLIPEPVTHKALQLLGFKTETQLCMLPLISRENAIGTMLIWGIDLRKSDISVLAVFASQVAGILQTTSDYESEVERADELDRSNSMVLALSKVAAKLESTSDTAEIFDTVGKELKKLGMDSIIGIFDDNKQIMRIKYISVNQDALRWVEKVTGRPMDEITVPRRLWPTDVVVNEGVAYWDPNLMKGTLNMFPVIPENLHKMAMKVAGLNVNDPVCYLPLANEQDVIGVLAVWGSELRRTDATTLNVFASQLATAIRNSNLYEAESRRSKELELLLEASEATSSSTQLSEVLLSLASKLTELSGFESCYISEWDKETNMIMGLVEHSRVYWRKEKRDVYSLSEYPITKKVLLTGTPVILQGDFDAEERNWMNELGRKALIILALKVREKTIGLVEIATRTENKLFDQSAVLECQKILDTADSLTDPLSENTPEVLFKIEKVLLKASGGDICSFSEWDRSNNRVLTLAVFEDVVWAGQYTRRPEEDSAWKMALYEGKSSYFVYPEEDQIVATGKDLSVMMDVESTIIFPLRRGNTNIGLIELYDFNHKRDITPAQLTLLRTVADKASYSIQNARLLQRAQEQLVEKTALLNDKEVLLKEVHHRVKNNLQVISSLLNLQSAKILDPETKDILRESQNRVRTMALIHEKLYQSTDLAQVDFASYLRSLVNFLSQSYHGKSDNVSIDVDAQNVMLDIDTAIPCGLIVNELVSNSLKYAFPDNRRGQIKLDCRHGNNGNYVLTVSDDGVGLPEGFDIAKTPSLGHKLVVSLTNQLNGKLEIVRERGTAFRISFERMSNAKGQHTNR
jgi:two-component sensor histidine kinase